MNQEDILDIQTIRNLLSDHDVTKEDGVLYLGDGTGAFLSPIANYELSQDGCLAMVYGNTPGDVWIRTKYLKGLQVFVEQTGLRIRDWSDFITTIKSTGYEVKQLGNSQSSTPRRKWWRK
jgi:hypothetical protein